MIQLKQINWTLLGFIAITLKATTFGANAADALIALGCLASLAYTKYTESRKVEEIAQSFDDRLKSLESRSSMSDYSRTVKR